MKTDYDVLMEAKLKRSVQRALKQMLEDIKNEPKLIIEARQDNTVADTAQLEDVLRWLFRRREVNNDD